MKEPLFIGKLDSVPKRFTRIQICLSQGLVMVVDLMQLYAIKHNT